MTSILKTYLPFLLLTILETHQETEQEEMLTSVEGLPFCSDLKQNHSFVKYFFGRERTHKSDSAISSKPSISFLFSVSCILFFSQSLDLLDFFQKNTASNSGHLKQTDSSDIWNWSTQLEHN